MHLIDSIKTGALIPELLMIPNVIWMLSPKTASKMPTLRLDVLHDY